MASASSPPPPTQFFQSTKNPGQKTAFRVYGTNNSKKKTERCPLVLIQGMSAVGTVDWHDLATVLQDSRTVITFDNRDMGQSSLSPATGNAGFSLQDLAQDVVDLVKHLGFAEIDICGHSMGGMIAQTLLTTPNLPIKIRHAILGATSAKAPRSELGIAVATEMKKQAMASSSSATSGKPKESQTKAQRDRQLTEIFMKFCYDEQWIKENPDVYEQRIQESLNSRRPAKTVQQQQRAIGKYDVRPQLSSIPDSLKVLVIHGDRDLAVYPDEKSEILKGIRHARLLKCPRDDSGHNWYDYFGLEFWKREITQFLDDGDSSNQRQSKL